MFAALYMEVRMKHAARSNRKVGNYILIVAGLLVAILVVSDTTGLGHSQVQIFLNWVDTVNFL